MKIKIPWLVKGSGKEATGRPLVNTVITEVEINDPDDCSFDNLTRLVFDNMSRICAEASGEPPGKPSYPFPTS